MSLLNPHTQTRAGHTVGAEWGMKNGVVKEGGMAQKVAPSPPP